MVQSSTEIDVIVALVAGSAMMLLLAACVVGFIILYQRRILRQEYAYKSMELKYQQELMNSTLESIETERSRLARDLHDEIGAALSAMRLLVGQINSKSGNPTLVTSLSEQYKDMIDHTIDSVRRISNDLLPSGLEEFGLSYAIEGLCEKCMELTQADISWEVADIPGLSNKQSLMLYRLAQELLNNGVKYAQAQHIHFAISLQEDQWIQLDYHDNGRGFDFDEAFQQKSLGLKNIRTRTEMLDGQLEFITKPNEGVQVKIKIPHPQGVAVAQ